jgi:membrane fusion protein, multidrug efflux system
MIMNTRQSIFSFFVIGIVSFIAVSCNHSSAKEDVKSKESTTPVIETIVLKKEQFETHLQMPGELQAFQQVDLYAKVTGFVKDLNVDIGSVVKTGQVLMTLEAPELISQLSAAESRLKSQEALYTASNANYNRLIETSKTPGTISQNDLDVAEAKKRSDYANLEAARASYKEVSDIRSYLVIKAPFDGTITARNVNLGGYVGPSGRGSEFPAFTLQQQRKLRLVISIPESYTAYLKQGDEVSFKVRALPSETFTASISRMAGALDNRLRAQRVEADIDNKNGTLLPGTVADVSIPLKAGTSSFIIPKSALVNSGEGLFVIRVNAEKKAERIFVKKGIEADTRVEVFGALNESDNLVKKASDEIKEGQQIY